MRRRRAPALVLALAIIGGHAPASGTDAPHLHLAFVRPSSETRRDMEMAPTALRDAAMLDARVAPGDSALAPCSLVAAGIIGLRINDFWAGIERDESQLPPSGTNILGMFDRELRGGKIPRDDPARAAEILARLYVWHLWGINGSANTFVDRTTQRRCLEVLVSRAGIAQLELETIFGRRGAAMISAHHAAVEYYSPTIDKAAAEPWVSHLGSKGVLTLSATSTGNPLHPCSLLRSLMHASRVANLWGSMLERGIKPPSPGDPWLGQYASALAGGAVPTADPVLAMQIAARLFAVRMITGSAFTEQYLAGSTQQDCVDEVFRPGLIRARLLKEGKFPPDAR